MKRLLILLGALVLMAASAVPASASEGHQYLALGDSVAFGTNPLLNPAIASNFTGYPEIVANTLNVEHWNAACPGEATGGFITLTGLDNSCRPYRQFYRLHVTYTSSQLDYAVGFLKAHPRTRLVTIDLGANDAFRLSSGKPGPAPWPPTGCYTPNLLAYFAAHGCAQQNLETIFAGLRKTGYTGLIVALTYYSLDYSSPFQVAQTKLLNSVMIAAASEYGVLVASGFDAFRGPSMVAGGSPCKAGLIIPLGGGVCDVHPTPKGRDLLAGAIVNTIAASCPGDVTGCLNRHRD